MFLKSLVFDIIEMLIPSGESRWQQATKSTSIPWLINELMGIGDGTILLWMRNPGPWPFCPLAWPPYCSSPFQECKE